MPPWTVEFRDRDRSARSVLEGRPILLPRSVQATFLSGNRCLIEPLELQRADPDSTAGVPDVVVGDLPILHLQESGLGLDLSYLTIPPPAPFGSDAVDQMWEEIRSRPIPIPSEVSAQGRLAAGRVEIDLPEGIVPEVLESAVRGCRRLLADWPREEDHVTLWRNVELRGGREDARLTERRMGRVLGLRPDPSRVLPQRTLRRQPRDRPWVSARLYAAARTAVSILDEQKFLEGVPADLVKGPVYRVAQLSSPGGVFVDPPFSSWPARAQRAYEALVALAGVLKTSTPSSGRAPLSHLWLLYENWVALEVAKGVESLPGVVATVDLGPGEGCLWRAQWVMPAGHVITVLSQPSVSGTPTGFGGALPHELLSVSSTLRPDALIVVSGKTETRLVAVDAKRRRLWTAMKPEEVAETGSKYVWGLRVAADPSTLVTRAVIASSVATGTMYSSDSKIDGKHVLPSARAAFSAGLIGYVEECVLEVA